MTNSSFEIDTPTSSIPDSENLFLISSKEVDRWFLMGSPLPVISILAAYLLFVLKLGLEFMRNRKPLEIKPIIILYDLYQTIYNFWLVTKMFTTPGLVHYLWKHCCYPIDPAINPLHPHLNELAWYFFFSKVMDLLDTVFFVLRKKRSNITFLQVYHHSSTLILTWVHLKYIKGEQGIVFGWINALIHTIMYVYYFLSTLGPRVQKYLWWKRYITQLQILQFILMIIYMTSLMLVKCRFPITMTVLIFFHGVMFSILFTNFYIKSYVINNKNKDKVNGTMSSIVKEGEKIQ